LKRPVTLKRPANPLKLRKTARIRNLATGTYLERIEFRISSAAMAKIELPPSTVSDPRLFAKHLRDAGMDPSANKLSLKILLETTAASKCKEELVYAAKTGWTKSGKAFVRYDKLIGKSPLKIVGFARSKPLDQRGMIRRRGSVESWKLSVGRLANASSIMMFTISAAFASALLKFTGKGTFGFCLFADSRSGKTLATAAAGSVVGTGTLEQMLDWNQTDKRLQEQLPEFNDCLVPVDDLMSMEGSDREKYSRIKSSAYIFALGADTGRHSSYSQGSSKNWRTILITSSEHSIRVLAGRSRTQRNPGETVRLIDLPATFDGATDIFDRVAALNGRERLWGQWYEACSQNQGRVFESFLEKLIARRTRMPEVIKKHIKAFVTLVGVESDGNLARDIAEKFGLVYAAGELAIQFRLVPWKSADLRGVIEKCYLASRDLLPDQGVTFRSGKQALLSYLQGLPKVASIDSTDCASLDGFRETVPGYNKCLVKREKFNSIFASNEECRLVTEWLISSKYVTLTKLSAAQRR
jgi:putative DNA primase/helicase